MQNKVVFITGASAGLGAMFAKRLSTERGIKLILLARRKDKLEELSKSLGCETHLIFADVSDRKMLENALQNIPSNFSSIDVLINNAGITLGSGEIHLRDIKDWETMINTNIGGLIYCTKLILPIMVNKNSGHIINVGSTAGSYPRPGNPVYCASKAFSKQFSLALRADLLGKKIRVTSIEPGTVSGTELALGRLDGDMRKLNQLYEGYEYLTPEDIAEVVYWSASLPDRININSIELMATCETFSKLSAAKSENF